MCENDGDDAAEPLSTACARAPCRPMTVHHRGRKASQLALTGCVVSDDAPSQLAKSFYVPLLKLYRRGIVVFVSF
jgi:hypothetical protein